MRLLDFFFKQNEQKKVLFDLNKVELIVMESKK